MEDLAVNDDLRAGEFRAARELLVNDLIELDGVSVRQVQGLANLKPDELIDIAD
jgi:hypothetical protein